LVAPAAGGFTALHLAAMDGINAIKVIPLLLLCGADPKIKDRMERTAYDVAVRVPPPPEPTPPLPLGPHACFRPICEQVAYEREFCAMALEGEAVKIEPEAVDYFRGQLREKHSLDLAKYSDEYRLLASEETGAGSNSLFVEPVSPAPVLGP
jgi:hypothetical protein